MIVKRLNEHHLELPESIHGKCHIVENHMTWLNSFYFLFSTDVLCGQTCQVVAHCRNQQENVVQNQFAQVLKQEVLQTEVRNII